MSAVSETIVREYFELHGFLIRQHRKYIAPHKREDEEFDFYVLNPKPIETAQPLPFVLASSNLPGLSRAVVVVKGWHTETFSPGLLAHAPEIFRFVEPAVFQQAEKQFGSGAPLTKVLVVPALPHSQEGRKQSIELLRSKGVDAVLPFRTLLSDLVDHTEVNRNYQKSDLLQVIRILKNYDFFKEPQLELFRSGGKSKTSRKRPFSS
jgi:hypothetical protein